MKKSVEKKRNKIRYGSVTWRLRMWLRMLIWLSFHWVDSFARGLWQWHTLNNIFIFIILVGLGVMLTLAVPFSLDLIFILWRDSDVEVLYEYIRNLSLSIGGVGAAIGLLIATQRQKTFSEQVQVQIDQSFNEKLGRGVELLTDENVVMRSAGIRVLEDLANNANEAQKTIIANIIYEFFQNRIKIKRKNNKPLPMSEKEKRRDVQSALDYLTSLPLGEREKLLPNRLVNDWQVDSQLVEGRLVDGILDFRNLDFSYLEFNSNMLERIDFSESCFYETTFGMKYSDDFSMVIGSNRPPENTICHCVFTFARIKNTIFSETSIESSYFHGIDIDFSSVTFPRVEFWGGGFSLKGGIRIPSKSASRSKLTSRAKSVVLSKMASQSKSILPCFIGVDFSDQDFNFANNLKSNRFFKSDKFFKFYYYPKDKRPSSKVDASRGYMEGVHGINVFVLPKKDSEEEDWSGQPAREWVEVEMAQWKFMRIKSLARFGSRYDEKDVTEAEDNFKRVEENLHRTQQTLGLTKKTPNPEPKTKKPKPKPKTPK